MGLHDILVTQCDVSQASGIRAVQDGQETGLCVNCYCGDGEHCDTSYVPDQNVDNFANAKITSVNDTSCYSLSHITL